MQLSNSWREDSVQLVLEELMSHFLPNTF